MIRKQKSENLFDFFPDLSMGFHGLKKEKKS